MTCASETRTLTVIQVVPMLESGGVERGTLEVAAALVNRGHRSIVISGGGRLVEQLTSEGSEHICWPIGRKHPITIRLIPKLRRLLQDLSADILHARSRLPAWVAYLALRGMKTASRPRFVTTVHSIYSVSPYSAIMTYGDRVISISKTTDRYIRTNYPRTDPDRIVRIERGVDEQEFPHGYQPTDEWLQHFQTQFPQAAKRNGPLLMLPGRIVPRKGHLDFLQLISRLHERGIAAHGLIVGGEKRKRSRYLQRILRATKQYRLESHITLTGSRSDIIDFYAISDLVFVLSGYPEEAFGRTALEALAIGTPVIGYDIGGIGEILASIFPQGRVSLGDIDTLTQRTIEFIEQPPSISPVQQFSRQTMLDKTLELYESLAAVDLVDHVAT